MRILLAVFIGVTVGVSCVSVEPDSHSFEAGVQSASDGDGLTHPAQSAQSADSSNSASAPYAPQEPRVYIDRLDDLAGNYLKEGARFHALDLRLPDGVRIDTLKGYVSAYWKAVYSVPEALLELTNGARFASLQDAALKDSVEHHFSEAEYCRGIRFTLTRNRSYADCVVNAWHFPDSILAKRAYAQIKTSSHNLWPKTMPLFGHKGRVVYLFTSPNMASCWGMKKIRDVYFKN